MALAYLNANEALPNLLHRVLTQSHLVPSRNGATRELTMQQITLLEPALQKEITVPGRRVSLPAQIAETMWILSGRNDIDWISHYLPRAAEFSDDNKVWRGGYGPRLRGFGSALHNGYAGQDQLKHIIEVLKADPTSRRAVFTIYDPEIDNSPGKDVPCNNWVHFLPREGVLHAHVAIRSNDLFWGWSGINAFEWTSLLQVVAALTGMTPGSVTFSISSLHLYERHWAKAAQIVEATREAGLGGLHAYPAGPGVSLPVDLPTLGYFDALVKDWFQIEGQIRKGGLSTTLLHRISTFPEPMLRSWLTVLLAWHHDDMGLLRAYEGTALSVAAALSPKRKPAPVQKKLVSENREEFTTFCHELHVEKNAAYGNSWMKRGEMLGIMANCARKVDRLGVGGAGDTAADTAIDLLMYFIKYDLWLEQQKHSDWHITEGEAHVDAVKNYLETLAGEKHSTLGNSELIHIIKEKFDDLEHLVTEKVYDRDHFVKQIIAWTYPLALRLWAKETRMAEVKTVPTVNEAQAEGAQIDAWMASNATRSFNGYATTEQ